MGLVGLVGLVGFVGFVGCNGSILAEPRFLGFMGLVRCFQLLIGNVDRMLAVDFLILKFIL